MLTHDEITEQAAHRALKRMEAYSSVLEYAISSILESHILDLGGYLGVYRFKQDVSLDIYIYMLQRVGAG